METDNPKFQCNDKFNYLFHHRKIFLYHYCYRYLFKHHDIIQELVDIKDLNSFLIAY